MFTWYLKALSRFAEFKGRSRRKEFFYFLLVDLIVSLVVAKIQGPMDFLSLGLFTSVYGIFWLITLVASLAVFVRRLHDVGKSGWNILWMLLPVIGPIILLLYLIQDSEPGANKYGASPKGFF